MSGGMHDPVYPQIDWTPAVCRKPGMNPDWWDPDTDAYDHTTAVAICRRCPIQADCRAWATITKQSWCIWGGKLFDRFNSRPAKTRGAA
jgi:hypothetical protein